MTAVTLAFCWSHVRRGFLRSRQGEGADCDRDTFTHRIALQIETSIRGKTAERRLAVRQAESQTAGRRSARLVHRAIAQTAQPRPTAEAIRYALNHWMGLEQFLDDGQAIRCWQGARRACADSL